jgi:hypothetical protein
MATKSDLQKQVEKMEAGQVVYDIGMQTFSEEQWKTFDGALEASLLLTYTVDDKKNITNVKVGTAENALEKAMEKFGAVVRSQKDAELLSQGVSTEFDTDLANKLVDDFLVAINRNETLMKKASLIFGMKRIHQITLQPIEIAGKNQFVDSAMYSSSKNAISDYETIKPYSKFSPRVESMEVEMLSALKKHK